MSICKVVNEEGIVWFSPGSPEQNTVKTTVLADLIQMRHPQGSDCLGGFPIDVRARKNLEGELEIAGYCPTCDTAGFFDLETQAWKLYC